MKLYLTEILKEANAFGFGAPGQGGNSANVSMAQTAPSPVAPPPGPAPMLQANPQAGGMMLPNTGGMGMGGQPQLQLGNPAFKPTI